VTETKNDFTLEASIPSVPLKSILCAEQLQRRPSFAPDYAKENHALVELVSGLADSPNCIFRRSWARSKMLPSVTSVALAPNERWQDAAC
jgi:hypothetical protein